MSDDADGVVSARRHLLQSLSAPVRDAVLAAARRRRYPAGTTVHERGDRADAWHLVETGSLASLVRAEAPRTTGLGGRPGRVGAAERTVCCELYRPGDAFGEVGILSIERRATTVVAVEDATTLRVAAADFKALRARHPELDAALLERLELRTATIRRQLAEVVLLTPEERIWRRLADLLPPSHASSVPIGADALAALAATTTPAAGAALARAHAAGWLRVDERSVTVIDRAALLRAATPVLPGPTSPLHRQGASATGRATTRP